jgi:subtilase family serine protease
LRSRVAWPASSPFVTAVGGTQLTLNGANRRTAEVVWNDLAILSANQRRAHRPPVGLANGLLYYLAKRAPSTIFDVVSGDNTYLRRVPGFSAKRGYDLASGLGVPQFAALATAVPAAGS